MAEAKIEIKVGAVSFSGEGEGKWLSEQLDKVFEKIPLLSKVVPPVNQDGGGGAGTPHDKAQGTLANFIASKNAKTGKTRKFLAGGALASGHARKERAFYWRR